MKPTPQIPIKNLGQNSLGNPPDRAKCAGHESKKLKGSKPGDRGMCEKQAAVQGSE
jgi:hypothetical protein